MLKANPEKITQERLMELFHYDPETGVLSRITARGNCASMAVSGSVGRGGYLRTRIDGKAYLNYRLAWLYVYGVWPGQIIDHIDGNTANNRIVNLRDVSSSTNLQNQRRAQAKNKSGLLGVSVHKGTGQFQAQIRYSGKRLHLGLYKTAASAHAAYLVAKRLMHTGNTL